MLLSRIVVTNVGGVYVSEYPPTPPGTTEDTYAQAGFLVAMDATLKFFGESLEQVSEIRGQNYVGLLDKIEDFLRIFGLFIIDEKTQIRRYIREIFRFIVRKLHSVVISADIRKDIVSDELVAIVSKVLGEVCSRIRNLLELLTELDRIYESIRNKYGGRTEEVVSSHIGGAIGILSIDDDGFVIRHIEDLDTILDAVENAIVSLKELLRAEKIEITERVRHEEIIGDALVSLINILGKKFVRIISGFLSGSDIIVFGSETVLDLFLKVSSLFELSPYIHTDDPQLVYLPNISVLILLEFYKEIPRGKSTAIIVDTIRKKIVGGTDIKIAKRIYSDIMRKIHRRASPIEIYRSVRQTVSDLQKSINMVLDFIRKEEKQDDFQNLIRELGRYGDLATLKAIFTVAIKLYPPGKIRLYELYRRCRDAIFPYIRVLEG